MYYSKRSIISEQRYCCWSNSSKTTYFEKLLPVEASTQNTKVDLL